MLATLERFAQAVGRVTPRILAAFIEVMFALALLHMGRRQSDAFVRPGNA
jgi:hypothetical protein